ncbi:MAG: AbrB family transcriptional regulator [Lachnospiraceae bacterium]|nr:AbrB family transcriptional regulator [Lachnospiraceae bacterium]
MDMWLSMLLTLVCAFAAGFVLYKLHVPGGLMLGGIIGAAAFNVLAGQAYMPFAARFFAQSVAGGFLGASIDRQKLRRLKDLIVPLLIIVGTMLLADLVIGWLIVRVSPLDAMTALASGIAGGINDVPLIAEELGADAGKVAVLQFVRLLTGIGLVPILIRLVDPSARNDGQHRAGRVKAASEVPVNEHLVTLAAALAGGFVGKLIGIPAGTLLFSLLAAAALHLITGKGRMRPQIKQAAQLFAGAYIGCLLKKEDVLELRFLVLPALVIVVVFVGACFFGAFVMRRLHALNLRESLLATTPAGASEIALLSEDLNISGQNSADIMILHIFRVICVVSVLPQMIPWLARLV